MPESRMGFFFSSRGREWFCPLWKPWVEMERSSSLSQLSGEVSTACTTLWRHSLPALPPPRQPPQDPAAAAIQPRALATAFLFLQLFWGGGSDTMPLLVELFPLLYNLFTIFIARSSVNCDSMYNLSVFLPLLSSVGKFKGTWSPCWAFEK